MRRTTPPARRLAAGIACLPLALALALPGVARAETLLEALRKAYDNNPELSAARAGQQVVDEEVTIARSQRLPQVSASAGLNQNVFATGIAGNGLDRSASAGAQLQVPLYTGGGVTNSIRAAQARVRGGRADLRASEAAIFSRVTAAYMNVLRDQAIVALNRNNVEVLAVNLRAARDRFEIGDITRTDVAQSEARLSIARSQQESAEANLIRSREEYLALVGDPPVDLQPPPPLPGLPATADLAVDVALADNPDVEAARRLVDAARFDVGVARSRRLPQVGVSATTSYQNALGSITSPFPGVDPDQSGISTGAGLNVTVPLFTGGATGARIRQAQARNSQAAEALIATERNIIAQTRAFFAAYRAAQQVIESTRQAVGANALSLEGVRAENSVGTRSILDILNAEQELLDAQVRLVQAERDAYVAGFNLLVSMGRAEGRDLGFAEDRLYNPFRNADAVQNRIFDWGRDAPDTVPKASRTVTQPPQDAAAPDIPRIPSQLD